MPERQTKPARRGALAFSVRRWLMAAAVLLVLLCGLGYAGVRESSDPRFAVTIAAISGISHTTRSQVIEAAALPPGQNAWLIDRRAISARIARLPWVDSARLSVRWPNRLHIEVTERKPVAFVVLAGNGEEPLPRYALIDDSQRVLRVSDQRGETETLPLLLVTPPPLAAIRAGSSLGSHDVSQALQALQRLRALGLQVSQVAIAPATGISALADRNLRVLFGEDADLAKKAAVFQAIVAKISEPDRVAYIDVRSVRTPTVLYR